MPESPTLSIFCLTNQPLTTKNEFSAFIDILHIVEAEAIHISTISLRCIRCVYL